MFPIIKLRTAYLIVATLIVSIVSSETAFATLTPAPSANFSPIFGNSSSVNFNNVSFSLNANGHPGIIGKSIYILPVICNGISISSWNDCEVDGASATYTTFTDSYSSVGVTFNNLALYYLGNNYITCYVYDASTDNGDFCGAEHYSTYTYFDYKEINYSGGLLPVYRFWSDSKRHHFFTINHAEKWNVESTYSTSEWRYEEPAFFAYRSEVCNASPVYRFWSDSKQGHFYTINESERDYIISNYPQNIWRYEGIAYCAHKDQVTSTPIHRFWSDTQQGHFYTANEDEKNQIISNYPTNVWRYEGVAFWAFQ